MASVPNLIKTKVWGEDRKEQEEQQEQEKGEQQEGKKEKMQELNIAAEPKEQYGKN